MDLELNNKLIAGFIVIALSIVLLSLAMFFFSPEGICLSALFGLLLGVIGLLLILSGGIESIKDWRSEENKRPSLLIIGIMAILFVAIIILQFLFPELREGYFADVIFPVIMVSLVLILFMYSKKSQ